MKVVHNKLVVIDWRNQILLFTWHLWPMTSRQLLYSCSKLAYILLFNNHNHLHEYMCNISVYFPTGGRDMKLTLCFMCSIWVWEWLPLTVTTVTPLCRLGRKCCSAKWVGCYVTLLLPVVLSLILLITLSQVPATDNIIHPGIAVQNDTVELQFNLPVWWLSGVTLEIKNTCAGKVFSTKGTACGARQQWWNTCMKTLILSSTCFQLLWYISIYQKTARRYCGYFQIMIYTFNTWISLSNLTVQLYLPSLSVLTQASILEAFNTMWQMQDTSA